MIYRSACLLLLLLLEVLIVTVRYDLGTIPPVQPAHHLITRAGDLLRLGLVIALAIMLVTGPSISREFATFSFGQRRASILAIAGNVTSFIGFVGLSEILFAGPGDRPGFLASIILPAWITVGLSTFASLMLALLPADLWAKLVRQYISRIMIGISLGAIAYAAGLLAQDQWRLLTQGTFLGVHALIQLFYSDAVCIPLLNQLGTQSFVVEIAPECSGYEGLGLIAVFIGASLWMFREEFQFPRSLVLIPLGMALSWGSNCLRIAALIAVGSWGYPDLAVGGFHSISGWLMFFIVGLGLIVWARSTPIFAVGVDSDNEFHGLEAAYLLPYLTIIAVSMINRAFGSVSDPYSPMNVAGASVVLLVYRRNYRELHCTWSWAGIVTGCAVYLGWITTARSVDLGALGTGLRPGFGMMPFASQLLWLIASIVGLLVTCPLAEELAFRGFLSRRFMSRDFETVPPSKLTWWSLLISALLFGVLQGRWMAGTVSGLAYGLLYRRRGSLSDAVLAHSVANGLVALPALLGI